MAGIPMYYGTSTFGGIEAKMARDRMDVLKPGEAEITICDYSEANNILGWKAVKTLPDYIDHWNALTYAI